MNKYNNDIDLINTSEMYSEMQRLHQIHQFGTVVNSEVPFWMNKDMYDDMQNVSNITNDNFDLLNKNRTSKVYFDSTDSKDYSNSYFQPAGDLEESKQHNIHSFENISTEKINNYLMTIVSGEEYPYECELGTMCSAGSLIVNLHQLIEMANDGSYNIITAQCFNPEMIAISFQQFNKKNNKYY